MRVSAAKLLTRLAALAFVTGAAAALSFGYLGFLHPAFDSFSHFRVHLAVLLAIAAPVLLLLSFRMEALVALLLGAVSLATTLDGLPGLRDRPPLASDEATYRLLHINLRYDHADPGRVLSLIGRTRPDVISLNEVSPMWMDRLAALEAAYPHWVTCAPRTRIGEVAIFSRRPFAAGTTPYCEPRGAFAHARIDFSGRPTDVATLHLGWPWPYHQHVQLPGLLPDLARIGHTALIAGDLNAVPWSHTARQVARATGADFLRGIGPTWLFGFAPDRLRRAIGLPIDNVLAKGGVIVHSAASIEGAGSDHLPVLVEFSVLPQEPEAEVLQAAVRGTGG